MLRLTWYPLRGYKGYCSELIEVHTLLIHRPVINLSFLHPSVVITPCCLAHVGGIVRLDGAGEVGEYLDDVTPACALADGFGSLGVSCDPTHYKVDDIERLVRTHASLVFQQRQAVLLARDRVQVDLAQGAHVFHEESEVKERLLQAGKA